MNDPRLHRGPGPNTSDLPVDLGVLRSFIGGDPQDLSESLALFVESVHRARRELREADRSGDAALAGSVAHRLKSAALYLGAAPLAAICQRIERAGKSDDLPAIRNEYAALEAEFERVLGAVESLRAMASSATPAATTAATTAATPGDA